MFSLWVEAEGRGGSIRILELFLLQNEQKPTSRKANKSAAYLLFSLITRNRSVIAADGRQGEVVKRQVECQTPLRCKHRRTFAVEETAFTLKQRSSLQAAGLSGLKNN